MNQIEVQIMGQSYLLGCPEDGEERLRAAVGRVHETMSRIRDAGKIKARDRIAVLAALNLAFDLGDKPAVPAAAESMETGFPESTADEDPRWAALLHRLDAVLGNDGRLL